jgi:transcriptional regulator with XRE-family HTH domain
MPHFNDKSPGHHCYHRPHHLVSLKGRPMTLVGDVICCAARYEARPLPKMKTKSRTKAPDSRDMEVGRRIRAQRLVRGLSQTDLGRSLGITFQQVQKYEKGANRVGAGRLTRIAETLGVPVAFFFGDHSGTGKADDASEALGFLETAGAVRLVKAYARISDTDVRRALVDLAESIAAGKM